MDSQQVESGLLSILTVTLFIASLYAYPNKLPRHDPFTIKIRFVSVCMASIISIYILNRYNKIDLSDLNVNVFSYDFLINGLVKPLFILGVIQFVSLLMLVQNGLENLTFELNIINLRNYLLAPFSEELNYRFILLKILRPAFSQSTACLISSFLFGVSHFHHLINSDLDLAFVSVLHQFVFTFLFALFSSAMYLKSGYLLTPIILHSICNFLCLPNFQIILSSRMLSMLTVFTFTLGIYLLIVF